MCCAWAASRRKLTCFPGGVGGVSETELMPRLVVGYTELDCGKLKRGKGLLESNLGVLPKLGYRCDRYDGYDG